MMQIYFLSFIVMTFSVYIYGAFLPSFFTFLVTHTSAENPNKNRTLALENLIDAPTLGQFFYEQLIHDYVILEEWEKVLNISKSAIESPLHKNNFVIWYYKATAECLLRQIQQCERSARVANGLSPHGEDSSVSHLYRLAQVMKENRAIKMIKKGSQIMIVYDSSLNPEIESNDEAMFAEPSAEVVVEQLKNDLNQIKAPPVELQQQNVNLEEF